MYRLDEEALTLKIDMAVWRAFDRHGKFINSRTDRGKIQGMVAAEIKKDLVNDHTCVVMAGTSGFSMGTRRKTFGVDEPWPAPLELEHHASRATKG